MPTTLEITIDPSRKRRMTSGGATIYPTNITLIADELVELDEYFFVELSTNDPGVILYPQNATVTIEDNDCKP